MGPDIGKRARRDRSAPKMIRTSALVTCGHKVAPSNQSACGGVPDVVTGKTDIQFLKSGIGGKAVVFEKVRIGLRLAEGFEKVFRGVRGD